MSAGPGPSLSLRTRLLLLVGGPLLVGSVFAIRATVQPAAAVEGATVERRARLLEEGFGGLLEAASEVAAAALDRSVAVALEHAAHGPLAERLEGVGLLDADLRYVEWEGMPAEPPPHLACAAWPSWAIRIDGVRTRLVARAGPDDTGRLALATFIIDSDLDEMSFERLLPAALRDAAVLTVALQDTETYYGDALVEAVDLGQPLPPAQPLQSATGAQSLLLRSPSGEVMAEAILRPPVPARVRALLLARGFAWTAVVLLVLAAALLDWRAMLGRSHGWALVILLLAGARWLLVRVDAAAVILPPELGTPSLYGSSRIWGLLASPADLLLTAGALYLACLAARAALERAPSSWRAAAPALALAGAISTGVASLAHSIASNSRLPLLDRPAPLFVWDAQMLLWIGLAWALLGAAELWAVSARLLWPRARAVPRWLPVTIALALLAAGSSLLIQRVGERLALEQLASSYAPEILDQSARRTVALELAVREIHDRYLRNEARLALAGGRRNLLAYRSWVGGELFHSGYKSSLEFYTPNGVPVSRFSFDLAPFEEEPPPPPQADGGLVVESEVLPQPLAAPQHLLHAAMPILLGGELLGTVVGHVLDEPENLPFLPWSRPYLSALGPGSPRTGGQEFANGPHYVLYDDNGSVLLTTLLQPPADSASFRDAASPGRPVQLRAGDRSYVGFALADERGQLHLLLVGARSVIDRLSAIVRLAVLCLLLQAVSRLLPRVVGPGGPASLVYGLRRSFYSKLLATVLIASVLPLVGLSLLLRGYVERRGQAAVITSATRLVGSAQRVVEDYAASQLESGEGAVELNDSLLHWLRQVVGQEIHVYADGLLQASSKRELFSSGLLPPRLEGQVQRRMVHGGLPYLVVHSQLGPSRIPVAYAPVRIEQSTSSGLVVAVPLILEQREIADAIAGLLEVILLSTVVLLALLAVAAAYLARTVARPVRELVEATGEIADGKYSTRLEARTHDEVARLVHGFNTMAEALGRQRADLERRRDYMEALLRHATTGVISVDARGRIVTVNPAASALLDASPGGPRVGEDLRHALSRTAELAPLVAALSRPAGGRVEPLEVDLERERTPRRFRLVRVELDDAAGQGFGELILLDDVTDMMRSNQLAAWAEMARAIAHEIKNPLTPIQLSAEHLRRMLRDRKVLPAPELDPCFDTIISQVRALYEIAGEFSAYAKLPALDPLPTDPVEFMRAAIAPYRSASGPVTIEESYQPAPRVSIDRRVLTRAVVNLVENALQAMPDGGRLMVAVASNADGSEVLLSVEDTGVGLSPEVRTRLFEPYFSTKSSGTGLGLAIVRRVVEAHHGRIDVESGAGRGTAFHIRLPACATATAPSAPPGAAGEPGILPGR